MKPVPMCSKCGGRFDPATPCPHPYALVRMEPRCEATAGHPYARCELPAGHSGLHQRENGAYQWPVISTMTVAEVKQKARQAELAELLHLSPGVTSMDLLDALDAGILAGIRTALQSTAREARRRAREVETQARGPLTLFADWLDTAAEVDLLGKI